MLVTSGPPLNSDLDLVARARRGDPSALTVLYDRCSASMFGAAIRLLADRADAEDLLQDVFVALPELLAKYEHRDRLDAWLRGVAVRVALARLRRGRRRHEIIQEDAATAATSVDPRDTWSAVDLERAINQLGENERTVFVLRQIEGYPHEEIAALLGISHGAVRVRYSRALEHLRAHLEFE